MNHANLIEFAAIHERSTPYNRASGAAVQAGYSLTWTQARRIIARAIKVYRARGDKAMVAATVQHVSHVGWPIIKRPNGRYI